MHRVVALIAGEVVAFDLAIPAQVFGREPERYAWALCAPVAGPVPSETGFDVVAPHGLEALAGADTVIVPGIGDHAWPLAPAALDALRAAAERGARIASICTGAFVLAAAGLLDGRRATTHWRYAERLARAFPRVTVEPDVLYVDEGDVLTSAGRRRGDRPLPPPRPARPRRGGGERGRAPDVRRRAPRRRPGAVRRARRSRRRRATASPPRGRGWTRGSASR